MNVAFTKKRIFVVLLLLIPVILNGCLSNDKEVLQIQTQAYNDELAFYQNTLKAISNCHSDIGEYETDSSVSAIRELLVQIDLIEKRYISSDFDEILPCEDAANFIKYNLDAVRLGKSAVDNIKKFYSQDRSSPDWSLSNWYSFVSDISNVYSNFTYASRKLESISNTLEQGNPIK
jgi:hypothetical protein